MRRKKDDKRVLRSGNGRKQRSGRRIRRNRNTAPFPPHNRNRRNPHKARKKVSNKVMFLVIFALIAFIIGAGVGVSLSFNEGHTEKPEFENVTEEMTSDLNQTDQVYYDRSVDEIDYNENDTSILNVNQQYEFNQSQYQQ